MSGNLIVKPVSGKLTHDTETFGKMDPFVSLKLGTEKYQTKVHTDAGKYPSWNETFSFRRAPGVDIMEIEVYDYDNISKNDLIGRADFFIGNLKPSVQENMYVEISYKGKSAGQILIEFLFYPDSAPQTNPHSNEQPVAYFPTGIFVPGMGQPGMYPNLPPQNFQPQGYPYPGQPFPGQQFPIQGGQAYPVQQPGQVYPVQQPGQTFPVEQPAGQGFPIPHHGQALPIVQPGLDNNPFVQQNIPAVTPVIEPHHGGGHPGGCGQGFIPPVFNPVPAEQEFKIETHNHLAGRENMNEPYLRTHLPAHRGPIGKIIVKGESKDQGWADEGASSCSWLEIAVENQSTGTEIGDRRRVAENLRFSDYRHFEKTLSDHSLLEHLSHPDTQLVLYARSMYPGWICEVKNAQIIVTTLNGQNFQPQAQVTSKAKKTYEENYHLSGHENMNKLYMKSKLPNIQRKIIKLKINGATKDQGWASADGSSSWVEIAVVDEHDHELSGRKKIVENYKFTEFRDFKVKVDDPEILRLLEGEGNQLAVYARSMYPGWICEISKMRLHFHLQQF